MFNKFLYDSVRICQSMTYDYNIKKNRYDNVYTIVNRN